MKSQPHIAVVINSFNRVELLKTCLYSLQSCVEDAQGKLTIEVFVYDAGSKDGSQEWLESERHAFNFGISCIDGSEDDDSSFSAGLNSGVARALNSKNPCDFLLFYETDNQMPAAEPLIDALEVLDADDTLGACGFTVRKRSGEAVGLGAPYPKLWHFLLGKQIVHRLGLENVPLKWELRGDRRFSYVDIVYTSPLLVKPEAWIQSEGMDALNFPFSECDVDWSKRLLNLGWRQGVIESESVIHDNAEALSDWSSKRALHFHYGRLRYFSIHYPIRTRLTCPHLLLLRHVFEKMAIPLFERSPERRKHLKKVCNLLLKTAFKCYKQSSK